MTAKDLPQFIICGVCGYAMELDEGNYMWRCKVCPAEMWVEEDRLKEIERAKRFKETAEQDRQRSLSRVGWDNRTEVLPIYPVPNGTGGSKSKRAKSPKKKPKVEKWQT